MRRTVVAVVLVLLLVVSAGCVARVNKVMESWEGAHVSDLIASWGPPQQIMNDGAGGKIYVWNQTRSFTSPGYATTTTTGQATGQATTYGSTTYGNAQGSQHSQTTYTPPQTTEYTASRMFWVNNSGVIYRWAWRGL